MKPEAQTPILSREQLEDRLEALHQASLGLVRNVSLDSLLENIATLACQQVGAQYAAVGVLDSSGKLEKFIPVGMTADEVGKMEHPPVGRGLIGHLMRYSETIRIPDIDQDPRRTGFPKHHPEMHSFLGVPIRQGNTSLGQIYLTNKMNGAEFSSEDQRMIETLATYAAVAIQNARLYEGMVQRDRILTRRWTWRQSNHTLTELTTREIEFNVDALPPVHESEVEAICQEVATLVAQFCGGQCRYEVLNVSHPAMKLGL